MMQFDKPYFPLQQQIVLPYSVNIVSSLLTFQADFID